MSRSESSVKLGSNNALPTFSCPNSANSAPGSSGLILTGKMPGGTSVISFCFWHPSGVHEQLGPATGGRFAKSPKRPPATICNPSGIRTLGTCLRRAAELGCLACDFSGEDESLGDALQDASAWIGVREVATASCSAPSPLALFSGPLRFRRDPCKVQQGRAHSGCGSAALRTLYFIVSPTAASWLNEPRHA
jgi:hypothetical protein